MKSNSDLLRLYIKYTRIADSCITVSQEIVMLRYKQLLINKLNRIYHNNNRGLIFARSSKCTRRSEAAKDIVHLVISY